MAGTFNPIKFESGRVLERQRTEVREARERVLEVAEKKHNARAERQRQMVARGDDKWMLPQLSDSISSAKKKKSKKKKSKKDKKEKKKKKKKDRSDKSSSGSSGSEDEWVESGANVSAKPEQKIERDGWMDFGSLATYSKAELNAEKSRKKEEERKAKEAADAPGRSSRELNPYFANNGSGMPTQSLQTKSAQSGPTAIGDGGVSWLMKAFKRAEEQAKEQNVPIEEIAEQRWGSLDNFHALLNKARSGGAQSVESRRPQAKARDTEGSSLAKYRREREGAAGSRRRRASRSRSRERRRSDSRDRKRSRSRGGKHDGRSRGRKDRSGSRSPDRSKDGRSHRRPRSSSSSSSGERKRSRSKDRRRKSKERSHRRPRSDSSDSSPKRKHDDYKRRRRSRSPSPEDRRHRFTKPSEDDGGSCRPDKNKFSSSSGSKGSWKTSQRKEEDRQKDFLAREEQEKRLKEAEAKTAVGSDSSSSSSSESEEEEAAEKVKETTREKILSEQELNSLAAKIVKAEIMGNTDVIDQLKKKLEDARAARERIIAAGGNPDEEEKALVVTKVQGLEAGGKRRKKTKVETHKDGQRVRYFGDDERYDLKQMFEREKMDTAEDQNALYSRMAGKATEKTNDDYDLDDMIVSKAGGKQNEEQEDVKRKQKAVRQQLELEKTLEDCRWCLGSRRSSKHLMVSMGKSVYLAVPGHTSMAEGHCLIVPMGHCKSVTVMDEDVWQEVQEYKQALVRMFNAQDEDCVFFETAMGFRRNPHTYLECVPMPRDMGDLAPMYFQKAIQECETEWSDNKKLIKLKDKKISRSVPKGLPYFHVDFGTDPGFAHVIEDEQAFSARFGHEIVGGMLDIEARTFRNPRWEQFEEQKRKVIQFGAMWKEYDWTSRLTADKDGSSSSSDSSDSD